MRNALSAARNFDVSALVLLVLLAVLPLRVPAAEAGAEPLAAPSVLLTVPAADEVNVSLTTPIEVRFSESMNASTLFYAIQPATPVTVTWPLADLLRLTPTGGLASCTVYDIQVAARDSDESLALVPGTVPNTWSFLSACDRPIILATAPADGQTNVPAGRDIVVTFTESMEPLSVRLTLNPSPTSMVTSWSGNGTVLTGRTDLAAGTTYVATVSGQDRQGNNLVPGLVPNPWTFTINDPPRVSAPALALMGCLNGGSTIAITCTMVDDLDRPEDLIVTLAYRNGTRLEPIVGPVTS